MFAGDGAHNSAALIPEMLEDGIRVLIYAGDQVCSCTQFLSRLTSPSPGADVVCIVAPKDFMCNWIGNKRWPLELDSIFKKELNAKEDKQWSLIGPGSPDPVGEM